MDRIFLDVDDPRTHTKNANGSHRVWQPYLFVELIRKLQPGANIFSDAGPDVRWVGNERGIAGETCWATLNVADFVPGRADEKRLNTGDRHGTHWVPAECDVSIRPGWFYHEKEDDKVRTAKNLIELYFSSVGRGASLHLNLSVDRRGRIHDNDVKSLLEFRRYLDRTFAKNLARGASVTEGQKRQSIGKFSPVNLVDDSRNTYWMPGTRSETLEITIDFRREVDINVVHLREFLPLGQRVEAFAVDKWENGKWIEFSSATSIGSCRLLRTERISTKKVRLRITRAAAMPAIAEFSVFAE